MLTHWVAHAASYADDVKALEEMAAWLCKTAV